MSRRVVDLSKLTMDDIFRAKEERRRHLSQLPFEQKIAIVKKLQTIPAILKDERIIFDSFLRAYPELAHEIKEWDVVENWYTKHDLETPAHPFDKRPDILAVTTSGKRIGIELKSWISRDQREKARRQERIQERILNAIGAQPPNETRNISYIWLRPKEVKFDTRDTMGFRAELFRLINEIDREVEKIGQGHRTIVTFTTHPILDKYLGSVRFFLTPNRRFTQRWIRFPSRGGHYSPNEMLETLSRALLAHRSDKRYKDLRSDLGLDEVYLLIHYDFKAFAYNTPLMPQVLASRRPRALLGRYSGVMVGFLIEFFFSISCGLKNKHLESSKPIERAQSPPLIGILHSSGFAA